MSNRQTDRNTRSGTMKRKTILGLDSVRRLKKRKATSYSMNEMEQVNKKEVENIIVMEAAEFLKEISEMKNKNSPRPIIDHKMLGKSVEDVIFKFKAHPTVSKTPELNDVFHKILGKHVEAEYEKHKARASRLNDESTKSYETGKKSRLLSKKCNVNGRYKSGPSVKKDEYKYACKKASEPEFSNRKVSYSGKNVDNDRYKSGPSVKKDGYKYSRKKASEPEVSYRGKKVDNGRYKSGPSVKKGQSSSSGDDDDDDSRYCDESSSSAETGQSSSSGDDDDDDDSRYSDESSSSAETGQSSSSDDDDDFSDESSPSAEKGKVILLSSSSSSEEEDLHLHDEVSAEDSGEDNLKLSDLFLKKQKICKEETRILQQKQTMNNEQVSREMCRKIADSFSGRGPMLDQRLFQSEQPLEVDELRLKSLDDPSGTVWSIKPELRESMYRHQQEGFEFLWKNLAGTTNLSELKTNPPGGIGGCIISHAPGTGKTRLTITFVETYMKLFPNCCPVIIAPAGMLITWEEEFRKWKFEFPFINLNNDESEKKAALVPKCHDKNTKRMSNLLTWIQGRAVLGISYNLFEKLTGENKSSKTGAKFLRTTLLEKPGLVFLDEGHIPRNQRSNIWKVLLTLQTPKRVILSGTPFQNNFSELFNTLHLVRPNIALNLVQGSIDSEMINPQKTRKTRNSQFQFPDNDNRYVETLKTSMAPFVHVHKGMILQQSLPGLQECVVVLKPPPLQKSLIEKLDGTVNSTFKFEHKVALLSVHPYLFRHCKSKEEDKIGINLAAVKASKLKPNEGVKVRFILELVRLSMLTNEKVLVFSQYIKPLNLINTYLKKGFNWTEGKQIVRLRGKMDTRQRQNLVNQFNDPENESKVMLASTKCCSEGISLVGASRVVLLDVVWNPSVETQAISRAYRIGQKKLVYTYHLLTSGTPEADKYCRKAEKERLSDMVFTSSSNECCKEKVSVIEEDTILGEMNDQANLNEMFDKIINNPKDMKNLIETFGLKMF